MKKKVAILLTTLFTGSSIFAVFDTAYSQRCISFGGRKVKIRRMYKPGATETNKTTGIGLSLYNKSH